MYKVFLTYDYKLLNYQFIKKEVGVQYIQTSLYILDTKILLNRKNKPIGNWGQSLALKGQS